MIDATTDLDQAQRDLDAEVARLQARQNEIANEKHRRLEISQQAANVWAQTAHEKKQRLESEHEVLVEKCRAAKQSLGQLSAEKQTAERLMNSAAQRFSEARANVSFHRHKEPNPDNYPTVDQVKQWELELEELVKVSTAAERELSEANAFYFQVRRKHGEAQETFESLTVQEKELRAQLKPHPWRSAGVFGRRAAGLA